MKYLIEPWQHQKDVIALNATRNEYALFWEPGTGKTGATVNLMRQVYKRERRYLRTLILCPPIVRFNWKKEIGMHSKIPPNEVLVLDGTGKKRVKQFISFRGNIVVTNFESLRNEDLRHLIYEWGTEIFIVDESHKVKSYNSKIARQCYHIAKRTKYRYILTGTPVLNTPMDLFSQFKVMDLGQTFGTAALGFRDRFFYDKNARMPKANYFPNWQPKPNIEAELNKMISEKSMVVEKSKCLDLPPLVKKMVEIELTAEQKKIYDEVKKDFVSYISDRKACVANMALTKALRLLQIVSGFVNTEDILTGEAQNVHFKKNPRDEALKEVFEEVLPTGKAIVWSVFKANYHSIRTVCEQMGVEYVEVHGGIPDAQKKKAIEEFTSPGGPQVLIGHPASAGIGINLVNAPTSIFYSRSFNLGDDIQAEARNYRGGSEVHKKVTRIDLVAPSTIDMYVYESLQAKMDLASKILELGDKL